MAPDYTFAFKMLQASLGFFLLLKNPKILVYIKKHTQMWTSVNQVGVKIVRQYLFQLTECPLKFKDFRS